MQPNTPYLSRRASAFWVRDYDPDDRSYRLCPVGGGDDIRVTIRKEAESKGKARDALLRALDRHKGHEPVRCILAKDAESGELFVDEAHGSQIVDREQRKMTTPDGTPIGEWTSTLDEAVFKHADAGFYREAMEFHDKLRTDTAAFAAVQTLALKLMSEETTRLKERLGTALGKHNGDLAKFLPGNYSVAMKGYEKSANGQIRQVRYDPTLRFAEQASAVSDNENGLSQIGNFAMQRATNEFFAQMCVACEKDDQGNVISLAEGMTNDLVREQTLLGRHPQKESADYVIESQETARLIGAMATAGILEAAGSKPCNADCDPLVVHERWNGAAIKQNRIHEEILDEIANQKLTHLEGQEKVEAYISLGLSRSNRYHHGAKLMVYNAQVASATSKAPKPKNPPSIEKKEAASAAQRKEDRSTLGDVEALHHAAGEGIKAVDTALKNATTAIPEGP